ncbi:MAG: rhodanese-like domain-containing protein [Acidobacteria bacterium]|nr:rhodanese-like domain-containing protein [Acidobacteriota bacterium]
MKIYSLLGRASLLLASACLAVACSKLAATSTSSPNSGPVVTPDPAVAAAVPSPTQNPEDLMPRIRPEEAKKLVDAGQAVIVDVRGTEAYKLSHIKGSIDYVLSKIEAGDFSGLPKGKRIIAYCT